MLNHNKIFSKNKIALREGFEPSRGISPTGSQGWIRKEDLQEYISLREIEGNSEEWIERIRAWLIEFLDYTQWKIDKKKTFEFLKKKMQIYTVTTYRKMLFQIRKFLLYLNIDWAREIKAPSQPEYRAKKISLEDIQNTIRYVSKFGIRYVALTLLGATSGMRAEEMYQLKPEDIDLENRIVYINHNPQKGQTTKTKKSRIAIFNGETKEVLERYLETFNSNSRYKYLFSKSECERVFRNAPIQVKDLRKFFSQEWERRGGSYAVKEILLGHSLKKSIDLSHYTYLDENELRRIYDKVIPSHFILIAHG